jgi:hypothetical protein
MTEQERAESFLRKHTDLFFCAACLAHELNLTTFHGRSLLWKLQALPDYEMRGGKCVNCTRGKRAIRHVGGFGILGPSGQVAAFLLTNKGIEFCDACLAFATECSLDEVRRIVNSLESLPEYERHDGKCTVCSRLLVRGL